MPGRGAVLLAAAGLLAWALAGCGGDGTGVDDRPSRLERVSPATDSAAVGEPVQPSLAVRVLSAAGDSLAGVRVRFQVASGPGQLDATSVTSDSRGVARTGFTAGQTVGQAIVRADLPDHPGVAAVEFTLKTLAPTQVRVAAVSGDGQQAETESQLPRPFVVEVTTPGGSPAGGVPVGWALTGAPSGAAGARLAVDTSYADAEGLASNLLTLGSEAGEYTVHARARGQADSTGFTATAVTELAGSVRVDSVSPLPLPAGGEATVHGSGFSATASENTVWVEGEPATVRTAAADRLEIAVPALEDRCLPPRTVGVRVEARDTLSNAVTVRLDPTGEPLELAVGELRRLRGAGAGCVHLDSATTAREYRVVVQSASRTSGAATPLRLTARSSDEVGAGTPTPSLAPPTPVRLGRSPTPYWALDPEDRGLAARVRIQEAAREELLRRGVRPVRWSPGDGRALRARTGAAAAVAADVPASGDTAEFILPVDENLRISCTDTTNRIGAVARALGERVVLWEDTLAPSPGFTSSDLQTLLTELDGTIFAVDTSYFGGVADIDGNERVNILFTTGVNALSPQGSETFVGGFFLPTDLADSGDPEGEGFRPLNSQGEPSICPASNEMEIVYLALPDPNGEFGRELDKDRAFRNARSVSAHELLHLISAEQRVILGNGDSFSALETVWLGEGLSHLAEEIAGLVMIGEGVRSNLGFQAVTRDVDAFNAFFLNNFSRGRFFMINPNETLPILQNDPGGIESLEMRGAAWLFVRWLGDQEGPGGTGGTLPGSREEELFRELSRGGPSHLHGIENVLRAVRVVAGGSPTWSGLLADFAVALTADDDVAGVDARHTFLTWDQRDVYLGLHNAEFSGGPNPFEEEYPLAVTAAGFESGAWDFEVQASAEAYFAFQDPGDVPSLALGLTSQGGGAPPGSAEVQLLVLRVR